MCGSTGFMPGYVKLPLCLMRVSRQGFTWLANKRFAATYIMHRLCIHISLAPDRARARFHPSVAGPKALQGQRCPFSGGLFWHYKMGRGVGILRPSWSLSNAIER
jgi:hypothetical protein